MFDPTEYLGEVPNWDSFYTVDELHRRAAELSGEYPSKVTLINLGKSTRGEEIECLRVGDGKYNALIHGFPNCEEPYGGNLIDFLARRLAENDDLREKLDYTWYLIGCSDPDGARLNEGFQVGPHTPINFSLNYYRTPNSITPESCFPFRFGPLDLNNPVAETRALMSLLDRIEFSFVSSLHMMKWGGVTYEVPHACPELYVHLWESAKRFNIFPRKRPGTTIAPGVMKADYLTPARGYARHWAAGNMNIEPIQGCYIYEYGQMLNPHMFMMIPECCIWYDPRMWDDTPTDSTLGDSLKYAHERATEADNYTLGIWRKMLPHLKAMSPYRKMMNEDLEPLIKMYTNVSNPPFKFNERTHARKATVAEKIGVEGREDLYIMFPLGGLIRTLSAEVERGGNNALEELRGEVTERLREYDRHLHKNYKVTMHPLRNLVGMGVSSLLYSAIYSKSRQP